MNNSEATSFGASSQKVMPGINNTGSARSGAFLAEREFTEGELANAAAISDAQKETSEGMA